jgi:hypothetical protein
MERCLAGGSFESCGHYRKDGTRRALEVVTLGVGATLESTCVLGVRVAQSLERGPALDASIAEGRPPGWSSPRRDGHPVDRQRRSRSTWRSCPSLASEVEGAAAGAFKTVSVDGLSIR